MTQFKRLSNREQDVANLLLEGNSNKLIASSLGISESTVEFHLKNIYVKYQVSSRVELILKLRESTVAGKREVAENGDKLNLRYWAESLKKAVSRFGEELKMTSSINSDVHEEGSTMTIQESILACFGKYADFDGRASRSEFWWFTLFIVLVASAFVYLSDALASVFLIATLLPLLAAGTRRLRDSGKSGWWQLFLLAPIAGIVLLGIMWALPPNNLSDE